MSVESFLNSLDIESDEHGETGDSESDNELNILYGDEDSDINIDVNIDDFNDIELHANKLAITGGGPSKYTGSAEEFQVSELFLGGACGGDLDDPDDLDDIEIYGDDEGDYEDESVNKKDEDESEDDDNILFNDDNDDNNNDDNILFNNDDVNNNDDDNNILGGYESDNIDIYEILGGHETDNILSDNDDILGRVENKHFGDAIRLYIKNVI